MEPSTWITLLPTVASSALYLTMMGAFGASMRQRSQRRASDITRAPRVTILKPLAGDDDELEENLATFARLDYPEYEVLFGVASHDDAALPVARRFIAKHPHLDARLLITDRANALNPKVAQLVALERHARGEIVVVSDSNVRVGTDYLWSLVRELERPGVGLVTSVFAGTGERTLGAALENLQLGTMVGPGIAAAAILSKRPFTVGKSMAMWRRDLALLGGFAPVGRVLAEDHMLGRLFMDAGYAVRTSFDAVENRNVRCSVRRSLERHTRWAKMRRALAPTAFVFEPLLTPLVVATAVAAVAQDDLSVAIAVTAALLQTACAWFAMRLLRGHAMRWYFAPLEIARTYLMFFCWMRACVSRRIGWRGHAFMLERDTVIAPAQPSSWSRIRAAVRA